MLFRLLKSVKNWVFSFGQGIADAEDNFVKGMFEEEIDDEGNKD
jgi:hypothetical protein